MYQWQNITVNWWHNLNTNLLGILLQEICQTELFYSLPWLKLKCYLEPNVWCYHVSVQFAIKVNTSHPGYWITFFSHPLATHLLCIVIILIVIQLRDSMNQLIFMSHFDGELSWACISITSNTTWLLRFNLLLYLGNCLSWMLLIMTMLNLNWWYTTWYTWPISETWLSHSSLVQSSVCLFLFCFFSSVYIYTDCNKKN